MESQLNELDEVVQAIQTERKKLLRVTTKRHEAETEYKQANIKLDTYRAKQIRIAELEKRKVKEAERKSLELIKKENALLKIREREMKKRDDNYNKDIKKLEVKAVKLHEKDKDLSSKEHKVGFDLKEAKSELKDSLEVRDHVEKEKKRMEKIRSIITKHERDLKAIIKEANNRIDKQSDRQEMKKRELKILEEKLLVSSEKLENRFALLRSREESVKAAIREYRLSN